MSWDVRPSVCENARMLLLEECRRELTEFSGQVHVHTVRERRQAEAAALRKHNAQLAENLRPPATPPPRNGAAPVDAGGDSQLRI